MRLHACIVDKVADDILMNLICKHAHQNPNNIDRIRKVFNKKTLRWVKAQRAVRRTEREQTRRSVRP